MKLILIGLASYLLGAIPFGLLIARSRGIDIRQHGSGNIGATNVLRVLGKPLGIFTFILDALKGFGPVFLAMRLVPGQAEAAGLTAGIAAILGHSFPIYLGGKGGKGVATSAGVLIGLAWQAALIGVAVWGAVFFLSRYVSLASILAAAAIPAVSWILYYPEKLATPIALTLLGLLIILRHRSNLQRLLKGTENRFVKKGKT
ncbi:MAG: glycerol-3-phosphate 1-O-acyltransferase PlsY [Verrucomicrobia bacterium]|nr:glycerol-3-phosphate 1-O-acyltransferase PlsY [Kiritimatiellia bacterium]MCB1100880.1 glycerol-3-phosphate 1-O-acyltransferase PlsY [Kiritimatiellia bacterium]MCP5487579.1 glycerol-3-phosphate 1-O-acyltransferase PlsY [Verrucomicrobiota bacterium]